MAKKNLLNALLVVIGWSVCVLGGGAWLWLIAAIMLVHLFYFGSWKREGKLLVSVFLAGSALDSFLLQLGVFDFGEHRQLVPASLALQWLLLGTTLRHCLAWSARPWWRASVLGAIGAPLSYYANAIFADLSFPHGTAPTLLLMGVIWAALLPVLHGFATLYSPDNRPA